MLEIKFVRQNLELVRDSLENRGQKNALKGFVECDSRRRAILLEVEKLKHQRNSASERIAKIKRDGKDPADLIAEMKAVSEKIKNLDGELAQEERTLRSVLMGIPNLPHTSVPVGGDGSRTICFWKHHNRLY